MEHTESCLISSFNQFLFKDYPKIYISSNWTSLAWTTFTVTNWLFIDSSRHRHLSLIIRFYWLEKAICKIGKSTKEVVLSLQLLSQEGGIKTTESLTVVKGSVQSNQVQEISLLFLSKILLAVAFCQLIYWKADTWLQSRWEKYLRRNINSVKADGIFGFGLKNIIIVLEKNNNSASIRKSLNKQDRFQPMTPIHNNGNLCVLVLNIVLPLPALLADNTHQKSFLSPLALQHFR